MSAEETSDGPRTRYQGPIEWLELEPGGRAVRLVRPAEPDRLLEADARRATNSQADVMPYWAYLWPSSRVLAEAVCRHEWPPGTRALELGCGLGYPGLAALAAGLNVDFTDNDEDPLRFVRESARASGFAPERWTTQLLSWTEPPDRSYPLILASEVLYEPGLVPLVVGVLRAMLGTNGQAWIAGAERSAAAEFEAALEAAGFRSTREATLALDWSGRPQRGSLYRIAWRNAATDLGGGRA